MGSATHRTTTTGWLAAGAMLLFGSLRAAQPMPAHAAPLRDCGSPDAPVLVVCTEDAEEFNPFDHPHYWRESLDSARFPLTVHFTHAFDSEIAATTLAVLESSWVRQVQELGFREPIAYDPSGSNRYRVFLVRGLHAGVDSIQPAERPGIWWNAWESYMYANPWGQYGGDALEALMAHELNHSIQASYDWNEGGSIYEMSSNYIQERLSPGTNTDYHEELSDFQSAPELPVDHYDDYDTLFMYGSYLYLFYLERRYFGDDPSFLARLWEASRSLPGESSRHWIQGVESLLPGGTTYVDTVIEFARWRYFTGARDDGRLNTVYEALPEDGVRISRTIGPKAIGKRIRGEKLKLLGSQYIRVLRPAKTKSGVLKIRFTGDKGANWVLQAVPAIDGSDGETLEVRDGRATLDMGSLTERVLIVTPVPHGQDGQDYLPGGDGADYRFRMRVSR